ncbi:IS3 family transposase [Sorangium sp. So ce1099]|uniref:IS3 family transposase n=1 Tax=Sorangium sp. So ce1099 TaxID=3133331 RepID=UPI003F60EC73
MGRRKRRAFTPEFKAEAVRLAKASDRSIGQVAKDLDLTETALRDWIKRADTDAGHGPSGALTTPEREELQRLRRDVKRLEMEREIPKKSGGLLREGKRVRFEFIDAEKAHYPVLVLCAVLLVSRSGYYGWAKRSESARAKSDAQLSVQIRAVHHKSRGRYGSPRIHAELRARGMRVGKKRVERLMRAQRLAARRKRRFRRTTDSRHNGPIAPNVIERQFDARTPNQVWVTDVTYIPTGEGWLYLAVILDLFSRRVVGWAASAFNDRALALSALAFALGTRRPAPGLVHHSDRGSPYASDDYRLVLGAHGLIPSMSRAGDCWDNAVAESFFATLKAELVEYERYPTRAAAIASIGDYIENFYNLKRRHSRLAYMSPIEFELKTYVTARAA